MVSKTKKIRVRSHKIQLICMHDASHTYNNIMMPKKVQYLWGQPTIMLLTRCKHISASVQCRWWWWKMGFAYLHCDSSLSLPQKYTWCALIMQKSKFRFVHHHQQRIKTEVVFIINFISNFAAIKCLLVFH